MRPTTVILTIHQPSSQIFHHFDQVILLGLGGIQLYAGKAAESRSWFAQRGYQCPEGWNPADCRSSPCHCTPGCFDSRPYLSLNRLSRPGHCSSERPRAGTSGSRFSKLVCRFRKAREWRFFEQHCRFDNPSIGFVRSTSIQDDCRFETFEPQERVSDRRGRQETEHGCAHPVRSSRETRGKESQEGLVAVREWHPVHPHFVSPSCIGIDIMRSTVHAQSRRCDRRSSRRWNVLQGRSEYRRWVPPYCVRL